MKKKVLFTCVLFLFAGILCSCGKSKTEYTIDEFADKWNTIIKRVTDETKYSTSSDIDDEIFQLKEKYSKKEGLTPGSELTISGRISAVTVLENGNIGFILQSADNSENLIDCISANQNLFFIDEGSNLKIKGTFLKNKEWSFTDCEVLSPQLTDPLFSPNLNSEYIGYASTYMGVIQWCHNIYEGYPFWVVHPDEFAYMKDIMKTYQYIAYLYDETSDTYLYCCFPEDVPLNEGNRIAVRGVLTPTGATSDCKNFIDCSSGYYIFE